jgi:hypothetical protein
MLLVQRLVSSSTRAIRATLERRLEVLDAPSEQLALFPAFGEADLEELDDLEQLDALTRMAVAAFKNERADVRRILDVARRAEAAGPDAKADALLGWLYRLQREERDPNLKVLLFTEFVPTQGMLAEFFRDRGIAAASLNGSMTLEERQRAQDDFAREARILVSTEAGGEGLNLQFCHVVCNYDLPWNPMRLEQRIGRVDRIGQHRVVRALNFVLEGTVEHRVREVLEQKLAVILREFGVDKTGDVLDSAEAGRIFDDVYAESLRDPSRLDGAIESALDRVRGRVRETRATASILGSEEELDPEEARRVTDHLLPTWVERMTIGYVRSRGGQAERGDRGWLLAWPGGERIQDVVFTAREATEIPGSRHLTPEDSRIRGLVMNVPPFALGQSVPHLLVADLPGDVHGIWSLWRIAVETADWRRYRILPLFVHDDGRLLPSTARHVWDRLVADDPVVTGADRATPELLAQTAAVAEDRGRASYDELLRMHHDRLGRERTKREESFAARRRALERIGLPTVRTHRIAQLEEEREVWLRETVRLADARPDLTPLLVARIGAGGG